MIRNMLAVLAAPIVWGLIGLPVNQLIFLLFPEAAAGQFNGPVLWLSLLASWGYSTVAGASARAIGSADFDVRGVYASVALLVVGLIMQGASWTLVPVWYHVAFLVSLMPFCMLGAKLVTRRRASL